MEKERKILLMYLMSEGTIKHVTTDVLNRTFLKNPKSAAASEAARKKGNALLLQQKRHDAQTHKAIFSYYCESISLAPMESQELALAYGNRSYLLLHMHKYEHCIKDIDRALKMSDSDVLKAKLLCRKVECLKKLGSSNVSNILKMVENLVEKIDGPDRIRLLKMIDAIKTLTVDTKNIEMNKKVDKKINDEELPITHDYASRVTIQYNKKYGRHLLATKDYKPGDIIFIENMYATAFKEGSTLLDCDHCSKEAWSSIPCDYCNLSMYCSESCKEKAWNSYHDVECFLVFHLKECLNQTWEPPVMPIRVLIIAIKESGSIKNLKKEIELLDQCADGPSEGFLVKNQFGINNFQNVYSLASFTPHDPLAGASTVVPLILISLTKYSILRDNFNVKQIEDLLKNEDIMFLGALLIKITALLSCNGAGVLNDDFKFTRKLSDITHSYQKKVLSVLFSLLSHSCFPTAEWRCTENNKLFVYALQPIAKNSQIFINYGYGFEKDVKSIRQEKILCKYNFVCDCQACVEEWPSAVIDQAPKQGELDGDLTNYFATQILEVLKNGQPLDKSHIEMLSMLIKQFSNGKQPSHRFCVIINLLREVFVNIYSPKSLLFEKCH